MTILDELAAHAKARSESSQKLISYDEMKYMALSLPDGSFEFENALSRKGMRFICECKKASPSKGIISEDYPFLKIANEYETAGADCISVLTEPKNALIKQYKRLLELDGVELVFTEEAAREVARQSSQRKMGARGLRSIIEKAMMKVMFEIPSDSSVGSCTITEDVIKGTGEPVLTRRDVMVPSGKGRKSFRKTGETA